MPKNLDICLTKWFAAASVIVWAGMALAQEPPEPQTAPVVVSLADSTVEPTSNEIPSQPAGPVVTPPLESLFSGLMQQDHSYREGDRSFDDVTPVQGTQGVLTDPVIADPTLSFPNPAVTPKPKESTKKWFERHTIRGYAQFRINEVVDQEPGSADPSYAGDASIDDERNFFIRRARLILSGEMNDRVSVYFQPDFASGVPGSPDADMYAQIRDLYGDINLTLDRVHRIRVGQSKVPYGWENLQSSSNRIPLDRNDGLNSAVRNERDLGIFYYYTPEWTQDIFKFVLDENLKGSGNYGMFGVGLYNGQGGSFRDRNEDVHVVARFTYPMQFENGQIIEIGMQGYAGRYVVLGSPIEPLGVGPPIIPAGTEQAGDTRGQLDQRMAWSFIRYPQPWGFQAEWNVGRGPALNETQTAVEVQSLYGGYAQLFYKKNSDKWGTFFPFVRYTEFVGGYKAYRNAPNSRMRDWEFGCEWLLNSALELTGSYLIADRTNINALASGESYLPFKGDVVRVQLQLNY